MPTTKKVVFVQGGKKKEEAYPWMFFHFDPHTDVDPGPVELVFFDYPDGKIKTWNSWTMRRDVAAPPGPSSEVVMPLVPMRLGDGTLGGDRPSIVSLYDWVKAQPRGSIVSLQVFSHGWREGPLLWNSYEFGPSGESIRGDFPHPRDPNDTDARVRDFFGSNPLSGAEGTRFAGAFAPGAFIKLWGCVSEDDARSPVRRFDPSPDNATERARNQERLGIYIDLMEFTYPVQFAKKLRLPVWASPFGWGSDPTAKVPTGGGRPPLRVKYRKVFPPDLKKDQWWRVSWYFRNQDGGARFYRDELRARIDAVDFVEYTATWLADAKARSMASLEPPPVTSPRGLQQQLLDRIPRLG